MPFIGRLSVAKSKHVRGLLRAGGYVAVLSLGLGAFQLRQAHAELKNRTLDLGRQMYQLANASHQDVNKLNLNGQVMWMGSSLSHDSTASVLDRYEAECKKNAAQSPESWRQLTQTSEKDAAKSADPTAGMSSSGVMRAGSLTEGTVLCFVKTEHSKASVGEAFKSLAETGELGAVGDLRYVWAKQGPSGNTTVLTAWTDDHFNLAELNPPEGKEARGADLPNLPRPPDSTRMFAAQVEGTPFGLNVYRGKLGPAKVISYYDEEMRSRGWLAIDPEIDKWMAKRGEANTDGVIGRLYEHDGVVLTLAAHIDQGDTITTLGLAGVASPEGTVTDTGVKASDARTGDAPTSGVKSASSQPAP
jgi:hypothetical protein